MRRSIYTSLFGIFSSFLVGCNGVDGLHYEEDMIDMSHQNANQVIDDGKDYIIEGDMRVSKDSEYGKEITESLSSSVSPRSIRRLSTTLWPNGVLTYYFDASVPTAERTTIQNAMKMWSDVSGVSFVSSTAGSNKLKIKKTSTIPTCSATITEDCCSPGYMCFGGSSNVGYSSSPGLEYSIGGTLRAGNIAHELGHALGFNHEQQRSNRDEYFNVTGSNSNNTIITAPTEEFVNYDFCSIMHYDQDSEIQLKDPSFDPGCSIGQRTALSWGDIKGVIGAYGDKMVATNESGKNRNDNTYKTINTTGITVAQCKTACSKEYSCVAWSHKTNYCYLKSYSGAVSTASGFTSGLKDHFLYEHPWASDDAGYELFLDGVRVGYTSWARDGAINNCNNYYNQIKTGFPEGNHYVECKYDGVFMGYELFWDNRRVGFEAGWTTDNAFYNCQWNRDNHGTATVVKCRYEGRELARGTFSTGSISARTWKHNTTTYPAGKVAVTNAGNGIIKVTLTGTANTQLYVKRGANPTASSYDCRDISTNTTKTCTVTNANGDYRVSVYNNGSSSASGSYVAEYLK